MSKYIHDLAVDIRKRLCSKGFHNVDQEIIFDLLKGCKSQADINNVESIIMEETPRSIENFPTPGTSTSQVDLNNSDFNDSGQHDCSIGNRKSEYSDSDDCEIEDDYYSQQEDVFESDEQYEQMHSTPPLLTILHLCQANPAQQNVVPLQCERSNSIEVLEENNNDPNNNLDEVQILQGTENNNNGNNNTESSVHESSITENSNHENSSPENGIDKNIQQPVESKKEHGYVRNSNGSSKFHSIKDSHKPTRMQSKINEEAKLIKNLLPRVKFSVIMKTLQKYKNIRNRTELALWDILPENKPEALNFTKRKQNDDICLLKVKRSYSESSSNESLIFNHPDEKNSSMLESIPSTSKTCILKTKKNTETHKTNSVALKQPVNVVNESNPPAFSAGIPSTSKAIPTNVSCIISKNGNSDSSVKQSNCTIIKPAKFIAPEIPSTLTFQRRPNQQSPKKMLVNPPNFVYKVAKKNKLTCSSNLAENHFQDVAGTFDEMKSVEKKEDQPKKNVQVKSNNGLVEETNTKRRSSVNNLVKDNGLSQKQPTENIKNMSPTSSTSSENESLELNKESLKTVVNSKETENQTDKKKSISVLTSKMQNIYYKLIVMFPYVDNSYINTLCYSMNLSQLTDQELIEDLVNILLENGYHYPRIVNTDDNLQMNDVDQYANLIEIFPNADPSYLKAIYEQSRHDPESIKSFIQAKLQTHDYPTREQYIAKQRITEQMEQYTKNFDVKTFLEVIPDPHETFSRPATAKVPLNPYAIDYLKNMFSNYKISTLTKLFAKNGHRLTPTVLELESMEPDMKSKRKVHFNLFPPHQNIPLLQEIAYLNHREEINQYLSEIKEREKIEFETLKANNALITCQCCFDDECTPSKCSACDNNHLFCNACIGRSAEIKLGMGETRVQCFLDCDSEFNLSVLSHVMPPTRFSILLKKRQEAEVKAAGLEGLVSCPFCHFASIPPPEDKVFRCLNPDCMKESCRLCKQLNHVPLKCDEMCGDKYRRLAEEKMTEALVRTCSNCHRAFFKEEGCNLMHCVCGVSSCYICDKVVKGYDHFNGQGSNNPNLCPLWCDNKRFNAECVIKVSQKVEEELKRQNPNVKIDLTALRPKLPPKERGPHDEIPILNAPQDRTLRIIDEIKK